MLHFQSPSVRSNLEIPTIRFPLGLLIAMKFERKKSNDPFIIVTQNCYAE